MAEVLGHIETQILASWTNWPEYDWALGHHLAIVWPTYLEEHVEICPYGDYYSPATSDHGDGDVQVFETFTNNLILRDGSDRDWQDPLNIVLNIRHDYDLDVEDITELLVFRIAMIPKTWTDAYGDTIKKTSAEISDCLNMLVDEKFKVDGMFRRKNNAAKPDKINAKPIKKPSKKPNGNKWNKNKNQEQGRSNAVKTTKKPFNKWRKERKNNQPKMTPEQWKHKQAARKVRLGLM